MKIEEAIETLEEKRKYCKMFYELSANPQEDYPSTAKFMDALELALTALHSMQEAGEPLSLEQLREMDGKPVWVEFEDGSGGLWGIVHISIFEQIVFPDGLHCTIGQPYYGKIYKTYSYPPAHIDRSKWEACDHCKKACWNCNHNLFAVKEMTKCDDCVNQSKWEFLAYQNYCPKCGRPLTEEAWVELERRLKMPEPPKEE